MSEAQAQPAIVAQPTPAEDRASLRRAMWEAAVCAGLGVGFGSLVFEGLQQMAIEHSPLRFCFECLVLLVATVVFLDRLIEHVAKMMGARPMRFPKGRQAVRWIIIGTTLGVLVLHKSLDVAIEKDPSGAIFLLLSCGLLAGSITIAWISGQKKQPYRSARRGALTGALVSLPFGLIVAIMLVMGKPVVDVTPTPPADVVARGAMAMKVYLWSFAMGYCVAFSFGWAFAGYIGGKAIDKQWWGGGSRAVLYIFTIFCIPIAGLLLLATFMRGKPNSDVLNWIAVGLGWGLGLVLHGEASDKLLHAKHLHAIPAQIPEQATAPVVTPPLQPEEVPSDHDTPKPPPKPRFGWKWQTAAVLLSLSLIGVLKMPKEPPLAIESVNFFESPGGPMPRASRTYQTHFRKDLARYIEFELHVVKKGKKDLSQLPIQAIWHWADGTDREDTVELKNDSEYVSFGRGFVTPGHWEAGDYSVDYLLFGKRIASGKFSVVEPPPDSDANSHPAAGSTFLPALQANANPQLRFFEGLQPSSTITQTHFDSIFMSTSARKIWWELQITFGPNSPNLSFTVHAKWYHDKILIADSKTSFQASKEAGPQYFVGSHGSDDPQWPKGNYHVDLYINTKHTAAGDFGVR